jgi:GT2 family glycosyltransferase
MKLVLGFATRKWKGYLDCIESWKPHPYPVVIIEDMDVLPAYQAIYTVTDEPIIGYPHDDVMCYEPKWYERVLCEFEDPTVGMVGFLGATRHGRPDIYKTPYDLPQLGRFGVKSNMRDAERHGQRFTGECDVAVLDGLAMFVRRSILDKVGGWPLDTPIGYFCYDYWLSCEVKRQGFRIRLVGVDVAHLGGKSSGFIDPDPNKSHAASHKWLYEHSRDVLPFEVKE